MLIFERKNLELWHGENREDLSFGFGYCKQYVCAEEGEYNTFQLTFILFGKQYDLQIGKSWVKKYGIL